MNIPRPPGHQRNHPSGGPTGRRAPRWPRGNLARVGIIVGVCVLVAAAVVLVVRNRAGTATPGGAVADGTLRAGAFTSVPGEYDPALGTTFPGQPLQAAFGVRAPSALSLSGYSVPATLGATGLLQVSTVKGDVVALNLVPVPDGFTVADSTTGFTSTAIALVALSPGLVTADPYADLLLEREISKLPETAAVSSDLQQAAKDTGTGYLAHPSPHTLIGISTAVDALRARLVADAAAIRSDPATLTATAPEPPLGPSTSPTSAVTVTTSAFRTAMSSRPPSCDGVGVRPVGGLEGDDICLTALKDEMPPDVHDEQISVRAINRAPRWAVLYRPNSDDRWPSGVVTPKTWSIPGLSDLLGAVADATANSSDTNGWKSAAAWVDDHSGVTYHPYFGADDFITALQLSVRRFATNSVSDLTVAPDATRQFDTVTLGQPWSDDPGAPPSSSGQALLPILLTVFDGVVKPIVLVVLDIKSATDEAAKSAEDRQREIATKNLVTPGTGCKSEGKPGLSKNLSKKTNKRELYICRLAEDGKLQYRRPLNTSVTGGDADSVDNDDCMHAYIDLAQSLALTLADIGNKLSDAADSVHKLLSVLGDAVKQMVGHLDVIGCLLSQELFKAAADGSLRAGAQDAAKTLIANNVTTVDALVTLIKQGQGVGNLGAQAVSGLLGSLVGSIGETVFAKVTKKLALAVVPGGDLLTAVNVAEKAGDITGLVIGLVDLVETETTFSNGSVYTTDAAAAVNAAAAMYPHDIGPESGTQVPYTPTYWGDADWVTSNVATGPAQSGFWVASKGQLDVFYADGTSDYTIRATTAAGHLVLAKTTPGSATPAWTKTIGENGTGDVGVVADDASGNLLVYLSHGALLAGGSASGMKIFNATTGALITDVDAQYTAGGYTTGLRPGSPAWVVPGDGTMIVTGLYTPPGAAVWVTDFAGSGGSATGGPPGAPVTTWTDSATNVTVFDDRSIWRDSATGLTRTGSLSATPAVNMNGITDPICSGSATYVSDNGLLVRDRIGGSNAWAVRVDPNQGAGAGNRALVSAVIPNGCDVVAADDHGVITRYSDVGGNPMPVWTSHYGYDLQRGQATTDAPYPVSDLQVTSNAVLAASNYDPHLAAFTLADGRQLYTYPLRGNTIALSRLTNGSLLAIGRDGDLTLLQI